MFNAQQRQLNSVRALMNIAIYVSGQDDRKVLIDHICHQQLLAGKLDMQGKKTAVFSKDTLLHFLREEYRHERFDVTGSADKPLSLMSEGEQKKALLAALLHTTPDVLIVDDLFDSLDVVSQQALAEQLQQLAGSINIVQLFGRYRDCLPFIDDVYCVRNDVLEVYQHQSLAPVANTVPAVPPAFEKPAVFADPLVDMRDIHVAFGDRKILNGISWTIRNGEFWQLKGPNGSGKSTLLKMISGDSPKGFGQPLFLFGHKKGSGESVWDIKKQIGYFTGSMIQHFSRDETLEDMVVSGFFDSVGLYQQARRQHYQLAMQWLQLIGLDEQAKQSFNALSAGHQRLVLVVRAMVKHPPLLILDEPATGLDDAEAAQLVSLVNTVAASRRSALVYVSHRDEEGLMPENILQLVPAVHGSTAVCHHRGR